MPLVIPRNFMHASYFIDGPAEAGGSVVTCGWELEPAIPFLQAQADQLIREFGAQLKNQTQPNFVFRGGRLIVNSEGILRAYDVSDATPGTSTGEPLMLNTACLVRKVTERYGRRHQGRMFIPGLQENHTTDGRTLSGPTRAAYQASINTWHTNSMSVTGVGQAMLLHSEGGVGEPPVGTTPPTVITSFVVQTILATQRRRLRR